MFLMYHFCEQQSNNLLEMLENGVYWESIHVEKWELPVAFHYLTAIFCVIDVTSNERYFFSMEIVAVKMQCRYRQHPRIQPCQCLWLMEIVCRQSNTVKKPIIEVCYNTIQQ
jgi:hypothetical protein